jgi:hypothetical protein
MKKLLAVLALVPLAAFAQAPGAGKPGPGRPDPERLEKRMRLARTLGLAEALDLDTAQALKADETLARFDDRRKAIGKQAADARDVLRRAAGDPKASAAEVDGAVAKLLDARTQAAALDREALQALTQGLSPDRKARATLFLWQFRRLQHRMEGEPDGRGMMRPGAGLGEDGRGMPGSPAFDRWAGRGGEGGYPDDGN